jgi:hypothetical protein
MAPLYVLARNGSGRPTLQHKTSLLYPTTSCGIDISGWSRSYSKKPIPEILCRKCGKL